METKDITLEITDTWKLVRAGQDYNTRINLYENINENYAYIRGDQWRGVESNGLPKPVINIIKRVRDYKVSSIMSQSIKGTYSCDNINYEARDEEEQLIIELIDKMNNYMEVLWEREKLDTKLRECLMDAFATGDMAMYIYWDTEKNDMSFEVIDGCNVLFGNPNVNEVERQPYILIVGRDTVKNLKDEAKRNGISKAKYEQIAVDKDLEYTASDEGKKELDGSSSLTDKTNYVIKLWKEDGKVYFSKSTRFVDIKEKTDTKLKKYPIAFANWEKIKNSYHGQSDVTGMLPNQRYINKQYAMLMLWMMFNALGKVAFDSTRINGWSNQIGAAIPVEGDLAGAIQQINPSSFNTGVLEFLNQTMKETMNALGVNDVVLGDIKPENTSAIIAVQKQSAVPLENVQANVYQFVEDIHLIVSEFMIAYYDINMDISQKDDQGNEYYTNFNSTPLKDKLMRVKIDVGASSMWSEITSMQTLDNLLAAEKITFLQYLERIPNGIIPKKQQLIDEIKEEIEQQQMLQEQQMLEEQQNQEYERIARELESLPPEVQQKFMQLSPGEQDKAIQEYMIMNQTQV